jgi:hypothetical protein
MKIWSVFVYILGGEWGKVHVYDRTAFSSYLISIAIPATSVRLDICFEAKLGQALQLDRASDLLANEDRWCEFTVSFMECRQLDIITQSKVMMRLATL